MCIQLLTCCPKLKFKFDNEICQSSWKINIFYKERFSSHPMFQLLLSPCYILINIVQPYFYDSNRLRFSKSHPSCIWHVIPVKVFFQWVKSIKEETKIPFCSKIIASILTFFIMSPTLSSMCLLSVAWTTCKFWAGEATWSVGVSSSSKIALFVFYSSRI